MSRRNEFLDAKIYVGGLPDDASSEELEDSFRRYGKVRKVWVARRPPGFAFVEMEDARDAEDAVRALDGNKLCGVRAKVELSHGKARPGGGSGGGGGRGHGGGRGGDRRGDRGSRRSPRRSPIRRSRSPKRSRSRSRSPRRDDRGSPRRSFSRSRSRSVSPSK